MKVNKFLVLVTVIFFITSGCDDESKIESSDANIVYKVVQGVKHVYAYNITNKKIVIAKDGIICFFDTKSKIKGFSNAISIIPKNIDDIQDIISILKKGIFSIDYELDHLLIKNGRNSLLLVVDNEIGNKYIDDNKNYAKVLKLDQLSFLKRRSFDLVKVDNKTLNKVNDYLISITYNKDKKDYFYMGGGKNCDNCTSGGPGSTQCSTGDIWSSCSVSCSAGKYACCNGDNNVCFCCDDNGN